MTYVLCNLDFWCIEAANEKLLSRIGMVIYMKIAFQIPVIFYFY